MNEEFTDFNINMNMEDVSAWGGAFEMILPGTYILEVANAKQDETRKGQPCIKLTYKVVDDSDQNGRTTQATYTLEPGSKGLGRTKHALLALGTNPNQIRGGELLGKRCVADIKHQQLDGQLLPDGTTGEPKTMVNVQNERPLPPDEPEVEEPAVAAVAVTAEAKPAAAAAAAVANRKPVASAKGNGATATRR